jgi:hypothetical protein
MKARSQILSPFLGDIVDSDIRLLYRPARLHELAGLNDNPMTRVNYIPPVKGLRIWLQIQ